MTNNEDFSQYDIKPDVLTFYDDIRKMVPQTGRSLKTLVNWLLRNFLSVDEVNAA